MNVETLFKFCVTPIKGLIFMVAHQMPHYEMQKHFSLLLVKSNAIKLQPAAF